MKDPMMQPCRRGCGELVHLENSGFHVCRPKATSPILTASEARDAAPRSEIERLRAELDQWRTWGIIEIAIRNVNVASYMKHWEERATKAEPERGSLRREFQWLRGLVTEREGHGGDIPVWLALEWIDAALADKLEAIAEQKT